MQTFHYFWDFLWMNFKWKFLQKHNLLNHLFNYLFLNRYLFFFVGEDMCMFTCLEVIEKVRVLVITFHMVRKYVYLLFTRLASSRPSGEFSASVFHIIVGMVTSQMFSLNAALEKSQRFRLGFSHTHDKNSAYFHDSQSLSNIYKNGHAYIHEFMVIYHIQGLINKI